MWNELKSARLQGVELSADGLLLEFYVGRGDCRWVLLNPAKSPNVDFLDAKPAVRGRQTVKPLTLFLRSHFTGHALSEVETLARGQVRLSFPMGRELTMHPTRNQFDIEATADGKSVRMRLNAVTATVASREPSIEKQLAKLERALKKVDQELASKRDQVWQRAGEWLLAAQALTDAPEEFATCLDHQQSFSWNLNRCFEKAKQIRAKIDGTQARRDEIANQLNELNDHIANGESTSARPEVINKNEKKDNLLMTARSRGRTYDVGNHLFFVGKSADDNLRLLRAAKPWHLWFHLRDYPGSFGILQINKGDQVGEASLHAAAYFLLKTQFGDKASRHQGDKFDILVAECRYVRPIKGDRVGRVNYSHARTVIHHFVHNK